MEWKLELCSGSQGFGLGMAKPKVQPKTPNPTRNQPVDFHSLDTGNISVLYHAYPVLDTLGAQRP